MNFVIIQRYQMKYILFLTTIIIGFTVQAQSTHHIIVPVNQPAECSVVTGLETPNLFKVFPNPVSRAFIVESQLENAQISLVDLQGREVFSDFSASGKIEVDVRRLKRGIYILKVVSGNHSDKIKISIQ